MVSIRIFKACEIYPINSNSSTHTTYLKSLGDGVNNSSLSGVPVEHLEGCVYKDTGLGMRVPTSELSTNRIVQ